MFTLSRNIAFAFADNDEEFVLQNVDDWPSW